MKQRDIEFLKKCERHKTFPKFIEKGLRVRNMNRGAEKAVRSGKLIWLKFEIKEHYGKLHDDRRELYGLHLLLSKNLSKNEWQHLRDETERVTNFKLIDKKRRLRRKFQNTKRSHSHIETPTTTSEPPNFPFVINRSTVDFTVDQLTLLNKGLKYRPAPEKIPLDEIVVHVEASMERCRENVRQWVREEVKPMIAQCTLNRGREFNIIKELKQKDVVYTNPDKGKGVVILNKTDYTEAMELHIREGPYELQKFKGAHPVDRLQNKVKESLQQLCDKGLLSGEQKRRLIVPNPRMPRMSGFPKIHKEGNQIRPVVTTIDSPTSKIAEFLVRKFRSYKKYESCSLKNSIELVKTLEQLEIEEECEMVSYDVKALFPSVPEAEAVLLLKEWCSSQEVSDEEVAVVCSLIDIVVSQKFFQFNGKIYKQLEGVEIGGKISAEVADTIMSHLEMKLLQQPHPPLFFGRYVDDIFGVVKKGTANELLNRLNGLHEKIQFTCEREVDGRLPFLDLMIVREGGKFKFEIYRKPTDSMLSIPAKSYTPRAYQMAAFHCMFNRRYNVPMSRDAFEKEEEYIFKAATVNGYKREEIRIIQRKHEKKSQEQKITLTREKSSAERGDGKMMILNYFPPITNRIEKIAKKVNINCVYKTQGTIGDFLINLKDRRRPEDKSGIYKIKCANCDDEYHGQCKRAMGKRWKEHTAARRLNQPWKSAVAKHCIELGHEIGEISCVKEVTNPFELNAWESYFIDNSENSMNEGEAPIRSPLFGLAHIRLDDD